VSVVIQKGLWQKVTTQELIALLQPNEAVRALLLKGSLVQESIQADVWSDVDVTVVVTDKALDVFFPTLDWLAPLGEIYTFSQSSSMFTRTSRVCFTDFRRIDFVFVEESVFLEQAVQSDIALPLFSRSLLVDDALKRTTSKQPPAPIITEKDFEHMVNQFWFRGMLTTSKVMRNDLLIATDLALELLQNVCVLEMMIRDRKEGTSHHREGGIGNNFIAQLDNARYSYTSEGILETVKQCGILFDTLAAQWSNKYQAKRFPLLAWLDYAQETLAHQKKQRSEL